VEKRVLGMAETGFERRLLGVGGDGVIPSRKEVTKGSAGGPGVEGERLRIYLKAKYNYLRIVEKKGNII